MRSCENWEGSGSLGQRAEAAALGPRRYYAIAQLMWSDSVTQHILKQLLIGP